MRIDVDLYSDTVTEPTRAMREFMCFAPVGDEQKQEDPSVNRLQETVADLLGKEAALFLPSATMANQIALKCHTEPGDEVIVDAGSHVVHFEVGGPAFHSGVMLRPLEGARGFFTAAQVQAAIRPPDFVHMPRTRAVWVENTHNQAGGTIWPREQLAAVAALARARGLALHMDGARLLNAAVAAGAPPAAFTEHVDTVTLCLSKGLGCPVGAVLAGPAALLDRARRYKHLFGGAMRQAGILAAAGLYALNHHVDRLADDHARARRLAQGLAGVPGVRIDPAAVETNIVFFACDDGLDPAALVAGCLAAGVRFSLPGQQIRAVTHLGIDDAAIDRAVAVVAEVAARR